MAGINDFLNQGSKSTLEDEFSKEQTFVEAGTHQIPEEFEEEEEAPHQAPPHRERKVYDDWLEPKLTKDELLAKAEMEAFKYGAIITGSLTMGYSLLGLMPQPLTPGESLIYDDYIVSKHRARKANETYLIDEADEIHDIIRRKRDFDNYTQEVKIDKEQMNMLKKAIFVTLNGKNERGELGQMSIAGAVASIAMIKAAPRLGELIPLVAGYVKKGIDKMRNTD